MCYPDPICLTDSTQERELLDSGMTPEVLHDVRSEGGLDIMRVISLW